MLEMNYGEKAENLFRQGYNCAQAVALAFAGETGADPESLLKLASSFGGGMGRLREVCGAVSGMFMVAGLLKGYSDPGDYDGKREHYARIQRMAEAFRAENGSIVCRELLGLPDGADGSVPEKRSQAYYQKRPCPCLVACAAEITARELGIGKDETPCVMSESKKESL